MLNLEGKLVNIVGHQALCEHALTNAHYYKYAKITVDNNKTLPKAHSCRKTCDCDNHKQEYTRNIIFFMS